MPRFRSFVFSMASPPVWSAMNLRDSCEPMKARTFVAVGGAHRVPRRVRDSRCQNPRLILPAYARLTDL